MSFILTAQSLKRAKESSCVLFEISDDHMKIIYLPRFAKEHKKLPEEIKQRAEQIEKMFRKNPFDPKLKTHKLQGELNTFLAFSIDYHYRIIFDFADKNIVRFYHIGLHDIYDI